MTIRLIVPHAAALLSLLLLAQPPTTGGIATPDRRDQQ